MKTKTMVFLMLLTAWCAAMAQGRPDTAKLIAAQQQALQKLAFMDGVWRGPATTTLANGDKHVITQTERVGPFLDGVVKVIEGRGYEADGRVSFNAFAIISFDPATKGYSMRSWAQGNQGDFVVTTSDDGFIWEIPAGPMVIRYTTVIKGGVWKEVGDKIFPNKEPVRFFEMELKRLGDSTWPAAGAVSAK